ncbi:putative hemolysin [Bacillus sp. TS-2]|nr:putative hemolysin [Bacillus sp. TS-2]
MIFIAIILLFIASSFFSGSETALTAANKIKIQTKADAGDKKSQNLLKLVKNSDEFIAGILIANNVPNIVLPSLVTIVALEYGFNVGIATGILTVAIIIFAEVLPKSIAAAFPDRMAYIVYPLTKFILTVLKPLTYMLNALTHLVIKVLGKNAVKQATFSKEEMRLMVDIGHVEGTFENDEMYRLKGMLDFQHLNVADVLKTPRVDVTGLSANTSFEEAREILLSSQYTRYPIFEDDMDHIIGVFHSKFFVSWSREPHKQVKEFSDLSPLYVYESQLVKHVFQTMTQEKKHLAIVLDEYGGTKGIITHEDLIEVMIGQDIEDETDIDDVLIESQSENELICDGKIPLHRLNTVFNTKIPTEEDNLAAFLLMQFGYLPKEGEIIEFDSLHFEILELEDKKMNRIKITKMNEQPLEI